MIHKQVGVLQPCVLLRRKWAFHSQSASLFAVHSQSAAPFTLAELAPYPPTSRKHPLCATPRGEGRILLRAVTCAQCRQSAVCAKGGGHYLFVGPFVSSFTTVGSPSFNTIIRPPYPPLVCSPSRPEEKFVFPFIPEAATQSRGTACFTSKGGGEAGMEAMLPITTHSSRKKTKVEYEGQVIPSRVDFFLHKRMPIFLKPVHF